MEEEVDRELAHNLLQEFHDDLDLISGNGEQLRSFLRCIIKLTDPDVLLSDQQWIAVQINIWKCPYNDFSSEQFANISFTIATYLNSCKRKY